MLIKATRIRATTGAKALARHLTQGEDNESITVLRGTIADLHDAVSDAKRFNRVYALRHFVIAPQVAMNSQQFERASQALGHEFGFDPARALVVEHQKARATENVTDRHWHIVVPETDPATGHVLSSRFDRARHEKIARLLELEFGHPIIAGAHDMAVLAALRSDGHDDLAGRLADALGRGPKPVAAYSTEAHQAGKRKGVDLAVARQNIRLAWMSSANGDDFRARLAGHGLELAGGDKAGVVIIRDTATGIVLGSANRLAGVRRAELTTLLERKHHDDQQPANRAECRQVDLGGYGNPQARSDHHSGLGEGHSTAHGGRAGVGAHHNGGLVADDREWRRAEPAGNRGFAPATGRAWVAPRAGQSNCLTSLLSRYILTVTR